MSHLRSIPFDAAYPMITVPFSGETIEDVGVSVKAVMKHPFDMLEFQAGTFNGVINFTQLWDVLTRISMETDEAPILFSCDMHALPEYYQTARDYADILSFAVRTTQIDTVAIESFLPPDTIADIADKCMESDVIPMITIRLKAHTTPDMMRAQLADMLGLDVHVFHVVMPVSTIEEIKSMEDTAAAFMQEHAHTNVIIQPIGTVAKEQLLQGNTFHSPLLFAAAGTETDTLPDSAALKAALTK